MNYNCNNKRSCNCNQSNDIKKCDNSLCCDGVPTVKFNVAKSKTICAYVDRVYDAKSGTGSPLFHAVTTDTLSYTSNLTLSPQNPNCCTPCSIGAGAVFFIDNCPKVELEDISLVTVPSASSILVNGSQVQAVSEITDSKIVVTLQQSNVIKQPDCEEQGKGLTSTLMLDTVGPWTYQAEYILTGNMNYAGQVCKFEAHIDTTAEISPDTLESTIIAQNLCIPSKDARIEIVIGGEISIINPQLSYDAATNVVTMTANVVIIPTIDAEVIENTKVCMQAMLD